MKSVAILGYGLSGKSAEKLLKLQGYDNITIFDDIKNYGYKSINEYRDEYDITIVSPGINLMKYNIEAKNAISEIELALDFVCNDKKIIAITGTNGKSTTTYLVAQLLKLVGFNAVACGNIGVTFSEVALDKNVDIFVIELSSFQIELLQRFRADAVAILNLTPDHLDRYESVENYYSSKLDLIKFLQLDGCLVSYDDKVIRDRLVQHHIGNIFIDKDLKTYPQLDNNILKFDNFYVDISKYNIFGFHNLINLSYSLILVSCFYKLEGDVTDIVSKLTSMKHRSEDIGTFKGVRYINDSKATNVASVVVAISSLSKPSTLLIGGKDKNSDYTLLIDQLNEHISKVCYFGEAAMLIHDQIASKLVIEQELFLNLEEALKYAVSVSEMGETIILSPACSSYDEFENYEDRGDKFCSYVKQYAGEDK